jgi:hypothetical protein
MLSGSLDDSSGWKWRRRYPDTDSLRNGQMVEKREAHEHGGKTIETDVLMSHYDCKARVKVKVKLFLCLTKHHATKTYWGNAGIAPCILDRGTRWK